MSRRLPLIARGLLRLAPMDTDPDRRDAARDDIEELFHERRDRDGMVKAHWRLYRDVASLWVRPPQPRPHASRPGRGSVVRDLRIDVGYTVRLFGRQPAIMTLAVAGLAVGLGIATASFSILNAALLRGEGVADPDRAPGLWRTTDRSESTTWAHDEFAALRRGGSTTRVEAVLSASATARTTGDASGQATEVAFVSDGFFTSAGARIAAGRAFDTGHPIDDSTVQAVVSHRFWQSRLGGDTAAIGRPIDIGRARAVIVGIVDAGFTAPNQRMIWLPLDAYGFVYSTAPAPPAAGLELFARLADDASASDVEGELSAIASALPGAPGAASAPVRVRLDAGEGLGRIPTADVIGIAGAVFAVIAMVLLLACANVATLLVSTAIAREREMAVRAAIGATRGRIVRQLLTESVTLGSVAAIAGLLLASWALPAVSRLLGASLDPALSPDWRVFAFLALVTLTTGVAAGLAPALHGRRADLTMPLNGGGARLTSAAPRRLRSALVAIQAAVSVALIVVAGLCVRATFRAATIDVGFDAAALFAAAPAQPGISTDDARVRAFWPQAEAALARVPGVRVTLAERAPFGDTSRISIDAAERRVAVTRVRANYFDVMGLRLLAGRGFTSDEIAAGAPVAVVSQSVARTYWPGESPLGQPLARGIATEKGRPVVVGIVSDAIMSDLRDRNTLAIYEPLDPAREGVAELLVRPVAAEASGPADIEPAAQALRAIDPSSEVTIESVASRLADEMAAPRVAAMLSGFVGLIAVFLCAVGLYGLTASLVRQRTREMGVRVALGARPRDLLRLLMGDSLRPVAVGLLIGAALAFAAARIILSTRFFGVPPHDPVAFAVAAGVVIAATSLAVVGPVRRAASVDAAVALQRL